MGRLAAQDMLAYTDTETALRWHLSSNHYPPIPQVYEAALDAIGAASAGDWGAKVMLPDGVTYRGEVWAPASVCVAAWHLDCFVDR